MKEDLQRARRVALLAALVTLGMAVGKWLVGSLVNSPALMADALHSATDMVALGASWFGLTIALRPPSRRFPYGFYRAETLGAMVASGLIIFLGGRFLWQSVSRLGAPSELRFSAAGLATSAISVFVALGLYLWEKKTSRLTGSQSLAATAEEVKLDMLTSAAVFVALLCSQYRIPYVEGLVTLAIAGLVLWAGFTNMWTAMLSLMDASIDPEMEREVTEIIEGISGVREVEQLRARKSGPFYFVEGHVKVKGTMDVVHSHGLAHQAQAEVREKKPRVEAVVLHMEPYHSELQRVLVPVASDEGLGAPASGHFGRAPFFLLATLRGMEIEDFRVEPNEFREKVMRAGLGVVRSFVRQRGLDAAIVKEIGEIAFQGLRDSAVEIYKTSEATAADALSAYQHKKLPLLTEPTHSSEQNLPGEGQDT